MTYPNRGLLKAAMGHYLTESARTALEAMEPDEDVVDVSAETIFFWSWGQGGGTREKCKLGRGNL